MKDRRRKPGRLILVLGILTYLLLQVVFFPSYYAFADEGCYVAMAFMFAAGRLTAEGLDMNLYRFEAVDGHLVGIHDAGLSWLMVPLTFFGDRALFVFNILIHLVGFLVFHQVVLRLGLNPVFSLLYLLHPTLWYHSRSIINDLPAGVFFLVAFYCLLVGSRAFVAAGLFFGLSVFVRPANVVFVGPFLLGWLVKALLEKRHGGEVRPEYRDVWKKVGMLAAGGLPIAVLLLLYNVGVMKSFIGFSPTRLGGGDGAVFSLRYIPLNLLRYGVSLSLLYPLMLVLAFLYRGPLRGAYTAALVVGGSFYMTCSYWGLGPPTRFNWVEDVVLGPRYLEAILPLMILAYAQSLGWLAVRLKQVFWVAFVTGIVLLFAADVTITVVHQHHMDRAAHFRDALFDSTPRNSLLLVDWPTKSRISASVLRPRRIVSAFPFGDGQDAARERIEALVDEYGEGYVCQLDTGGIIWVSPKAVRDREALLAKYPGEKILDEEKGGWRLVITRIKPGGDLQTP